MQIKLKLFYFLFLFLVILFPSNIYARNLTCNISLETFNFITGDLEIKGKLNKQIREELKLNLTYNFDKDEKSIKIESIKTVNNFYQNLFKHNEYAKKNLLNLFSNKNYKLTMNDISNSLNLENIKIIYTYDNKKYINSNMIDRIYYEEKNFNNDMYKLINENWIFNQNFFYNYIGLDKDEDFSLIENYDYVEFISNNIFKIKNNYSKEIKKFNNDLYDISFINEDNNSIYNIISMIGIVGDTTYYVSLGGYCPNIDKNNKSFVQPVF